MNPLRHFVILAGIAASWSVALIVARRLNVPDSGGFYFFFCLTGALHALSRAAVRDRDKR